MRRLTDAQHKTLDELDESCYVIGWSDQLHGPVVADRRMHAVIAPDGRTWPVFS